MSIETYRNGYGDLMCATHHVRLIVGSPRWDYTGKPRRVQPEPWCPDCQRELRQAS